MRSLCILPALMMLVVASSACSKDKAKREPKPGDKPGTAAATGDKPGTAAPDGAACTETTAVTVALAAEDGKLPDGGYQLQNTIGFADKDLTGPDDITSVVYGNYALLDTYGPRSTVDYNWPEKAGEIAVEVNFQTEGALAAGDYPAGVAAPKTFEVKLLAGGGDTAPGFNKTGKATVTVATESRLCGQFEATNEAGSSVKGTFNLPLKQHRSKK